MESENAMEDLIISAEPVLPEIEPVPDDVFSHEDTTSGTPDWESFLRMIKSQELTYFALPVMTQLCRRSFHMAKVQGPFDLPKLAREYRRKLYRTGMYHPCNDKARVERLLICMDERTYVVYDEPELTVYAPTPQAAARVANQMKLYRLPDDEKPGFRLVSLNSGQPSAQMVVVEKAAPVNENDLALHYGDDFIEWERTWLERLRQRRSGVTVLYGPPGCGKTSYLRGLMSRLMGQFEFYYIPVSAFDVLSSPSFVSFWMEREDGTRARQRIAVMEDAEELLLPRDAGSREKVSNLLNIGDGFLGEHLKLHVIATTNAPAPQLDPALLRPGRLMGSREFRRLSRMEASRLASAKGLAVPEAETISLAEIYCAGRVAPSFNQERKIGFAGTTRND